MTEAKRQCSARLTSWGRRGEPCTNSPLEGHSYCGQHPPSKPYSAARALRAKHERIGRLVVEHAEALECYKDVACLPVEAPTLKAALEAILKEVES